MIRPTTPEDTSVLVQVASGTAVFKPMEIATLREVLDDYFAENRSLGHRCVTLEHEGHIVGFAYYAPAAMTERSWQLYWIAISRDQHARGLGGKLLHFVEDDIRAANGLCLFIETSSTPNYELTRRFYVRHNYDREAVLRDFYAENDDMVIFRKKLVV